uniref:Secreted protein n=1 Tax=Setaria italica TaxID=4555 RepID=K3YKI2_SETIT
MAMRVLVALSPWLAWLTLLAHASIASLCYHFHTANTYASLNLFSDRTNAWISQYNNDGSSGRTRGRMKASEVCCMKLAGEDTMMMIH